MSNEQTQEFPTIPETTVIPPSAEDAQLLISTAFIFDNSVPRLCSSLNVMSTVTTIARTFRNSSSGNATNTQTPVNNIFHRPPAPTQPRGPHRLLHKECTVTSSDRLSKQRGTIVKVTIGDNDQETFSIACINRNNPSFTYFIEATRGQFVLEDVQAQYGSVMEIPSSILLQQQSTSSKSKFTINNTNLKKQRIESEHSKRSKWKVVVVTDKQIPFALRNFDAKGVRITPSLLQIQTPYMPGLRQVVLSNTKTTKKNVDGLTRKTRMRTVFDLIGDRRRGSIQGSSPLIRIFDSERYSFAFRLVIEEYLDLIVVTDNTKSYVGVRVTQVLALVSLSLKLLIDDHYSLWENVSFLYGVNAPSDSRPTATLPNGSVLQLENLNAFSRRQRVLVLATSSKCTFCGTVSTTYNNLVYLSLSNAVVCASCLVVERDNLAIALSTVSALQLGFNSSKNYANDVPCINFKTISQQERLLLSGVHSKARSCTVVSSLLAIIKARLPFKSKESRLSNSSSSTSSTSSSSSSSSSSLNNDTTDSITQILKNEAIQLKMDSPHPILQATSLFKDDKLDIQFYGTARRYLFVALFSSLTPPEEDKDDFDNTSILEIVLPIERSPPNLTIAIKEIQKRRKENKKKIRTARANQQTKQNEYMVQPLNQFQNRVVAVFDPVSLAIESGHFLGGIIINDVLHFNIQLFPPSSSSSTSSSSSSSRTTQMIRPNFVAFVKI